MLKKLSLVDLIAAIQKRVEGTTDLRCYDAVGKNTESPFCFVEVVGKRPANTKTMFREIFTVWIHAISVSEDGNIGIYQMIEQVEESLTEDIELPKPFELILQSGLGVQTIKKEVTRENHAVVAYEFMVCYGFKMKV